MKKISLLLIALFCIALSPLTYANHHEAVESTNEKKCEGITNGSFSISGLDANKDGTITKEEYLSGDNTNSEIIFKHIDANGDGQLDQAEQKDIEVAYKDIHNKYKSKNTNI